MRTFSSFLRRRVVTESGQALGRCRDLRGELSDGSLRITGLSVGRYAWLEHLGIGIHRPDTVIAWASIVEIRGREIVVRDDHGGEQRSS